jgi:hypothetical protein
MKRSFSNLLGIVPISALIASAGCTANLPFRTHLASTDPFDPAAVIEDRTDYKIGFVEFDDQGCFWNLQQRETVEKMVRAEAGIGPRTTQPTTVAATAPTDAPGIVLVAFVHGWKDNASHDGDGVKAFRSILQQLHEAEQAQKDHAPRKVIGVYMGWRGLSATWEPFEELSFWERKQTAHKVGGYGAMTALMVDLENIQKQSLDALPPTAPRTELIIIGHSFGGAAVYSALSQIITERFVDTVEKGNRLKPLGDQVILLNPAFEAARHYDLNQMAVSINQYPPNQRPVLSVFTSRGDWATHIAFPVGRFFATLFDAMRDHQQYLASLKTIGWFAPFITHRLDMNTPAGTTQPVADLTDHGAMAASNENIKAQRSKWHPNGVVPQQYDFSYSRTVITPMPTYHPGDPFWIVSVDPQIMANHTDITNPNLIRFIVDYIQFCRPDTGDHAK